MAFESLSPPRWPFTNQQVVPTGTRIAMGLNTTYVHGTSGNGMAFRFVPRNTSGVSKAFVFLDATTGTRANITLRARIYTAIGATQPSTTLVATADTVVYPSVDDRWIEITFNTPTTLTAGTQYFLVIDNTAIAPATDFASLLSQTNHFYSANNLLGTAGLTTANGFSTAGTMAAEAPHVFRFADGFTVGQPFTQQNARFASNTLQRGLILPNRYRGLQLIGATIFGTVTDFRIYRSDQLPSDTPILQLSPTAQDRIHWLLRFPTPLTLTGATDWYLVCNSSSSTSAPNCGNIEDYASFPAIFNELFADNLGVSAGVQDSGSNTWNLFPADAPQASFFTGDFASSSGGGLLLPRPMNGGYSA